MNYRLGIFGFMTHPELTKESGHSSSGNYGATHIPFEMFERAAGVKFLHVPYRGGGPAMQAFLGAQVDVTAQAPGVAGPHARDGKVRILAHWGAKPTPAPRAGAAPLR